MPTRSAYRLCYGCSLSNGSHNGPSQDTERLRETPIKAIFVHLVSHIGSIPIKFSPGKGIDILPKRIFIGGDLYSGAVAAHVVMVLIGLRHPFMEYDLSHVSRFDNILRESITVIVMTCVLVIKGWGNCCLQKAVPLVL